MDDRKYVRMVVCHIAPDSAYWWRRPACIVSLLEWNPGRYEEQLGRWEGAPADREALCNAARAWAEAEGFGCIFGDQRSTLTDDGFGNEVERFGHAPGSPFRRLLYVRLGADPLGDLRTIDWPLIEPY